MFNGQMSESRAESVTIPDVDAECFRIILEAIYRGKLQLPEEEKEKKGQKEQGHEEKKGGEAEDDEDGQIDSLVLLQLRQRFGKSSNDVMFASTA